MARRGGITAADVMAVSSATPPPPSAPNATIAQLGKGGGGGGFLGALKNLGGTALDVLSVPQAAAFTVNTNLLKWAQGKPGVSWKNMGGGFYDKYTGSRGTLLNAFNVDPESKFAKWGGLGIDVLADPMWAVSLVPGAGEAYAAAKFGRAARALGQLNNIKGGAEALAKLEKLGPIKAIGPFSKNYNKFMDVKGSRKFYELALGERPALAMKGAGSKKGLDLADLDAAIMRMRADAGTARVATKDMGYIPSITLGTKRLGGVTVPLWHKPVRVGKAIRASGGRFRTTALQAEVSALRNVAESRSNMSTNELNALYKSVYKGADVDVASDVAVGMALLKRAKSAEEGRAAIKVLRERGLWSDEAQKLFDNAVDGLRQQARLTGTMAADDFAATLRSWLASSGGRVGETAQAARPRAQRLREKLLRDFGNALSPEEKRALASYQQQLAKLANEGQQFSPEYDRVRDLAAKLSAKQNDAVSKYRQRLARIDAAEQGVVENADNKAYGELLTALRESDPAVAQALETGGRKVDPARVHPGIVEQLGNVSKMTHARRAEEVGNLIALLERLDYIPTPVRPMSETSSKGIKDALAQAQKLGKAMPDQLVGDSMHSADAGRFNTVYNQLDVVTRDNVMAELERLGVPDAEEVADELAEAFKLTEEGVLFWQQGAEYGLDAVELSPELRGRELMAAGARGAFDAVARKEMERMVRALGMNNPAALKAMQEDVNAIAKALGDRAPELADDALTKGDVVLDDPTSTEQAIAKALEDRQVRNITSAMTAQYNVGYDNAVGWLNARPLGDRGPSLNDMLGYLKVWFTSMNPAHFFTNAWGSMVNGIIEGGLRQASMRASVPGSDYWKLAGDLTKLSPEFLAKTVKIGPHTYTYADVAVMSRLMGLGLGHGQAAQEVELMIHLMENASRTKNPLKMWARFGHKMNMNREDADRILAWVNFMKSGDNPVTAAARVLHSRFDYGALTHFEKVWMRNLMLFYTWFRKNMEYQAWGVMARPGMYNAFQSMERNRPHDPNEPAYLQKAFGVWVPLLGQSNVTFANPMADVFKFDFTQEALRRNLGASLNPLFLTPIEAGMNKRFFSGAEIDKYPLADQRVPNQVLGRIPFLGGTARASAGSAPEPGVSPLVDLMWDSFKGPLGGQLEKGLTPGENTEMSKYQPLLKSFTGLTINHPEPVKWRRNKYYETLNRMADLSAMYRLQR